MSLLPSFTPCFTLPADGLALARRLAPRSAPAPIAELSGILSLFDAVRSGGDAAVLKATRDHDGVMLRGLAVDARDVAADAAALPPGLRAAIEQALAHILAVNARLLPSDTDDLVRPGTRV